MEPIARPRRRFTEERDDVVTIQHRGRRRQPVPQVGGSCEHPLLPPVARAIVPMRGRPLLSVMRVIRTC